MTPKEKLTIELIFLSTCLIVAVIFWAIGFSQGWGSGYIEGQKPLMEDCGFYYDYSTGNYVRDMTQLRINFTIIENATS